ncbi:MAG: NUDIX domain-containing protein [Kouleothrix sp.]
MDEQAETYDPTRYERPSVTVDVVVFTLQDHELHMLLVKRKHWPYEGHCAAGRLHQYERIGIEQASARRELEEETGVRDIYLEQLYTFGEPRRDPRTRVIRYRLHCAGERRQTNPARVGRKASMCAGFRCSDCPAYSPSITT